MNLFSTALLIIFCVYQTYFLIFYRFRGATVPCVDTHDDAVTTKASTKEFLNPSARKCDDCEGVCGGSSVSCVGSATSDRVCTFKYLCYSQERNDFVFLHGRNSFQSGLPSNRFNPALLDFTSIDDHNTRYFDFVDVGATNICQGGNINISLRRGNYLIMQRFKPDNLMHLFHDDLLPTFVTLRKHHVLEGNGTVLVFADKYRKLQFDYIFKALPIHSIIYITDLYKGFTCFETAVVGLTKETTWYQYGFHSMQGAIPGKTVNRGHLLDFTNRLERELCLMHSHWETEEKKNHETSNSRYVLFLSRAHNRRIINELEVVRFLAQYYNLHVHVVRLEDQTMHDLLCLVKNANVLVGMHGSLMILSMFLRPSTTVVELFPYAINPAMYTPYRTLSKILGLRYYAWANPFLHNTIGHPDWHEEYGGISHLPKKEQEKIVASQSVPEHLCCKDPNWLYHIFQDTIVDINSLQAVITQTIDVVEETTQKYKVFPTFVRIEYCLFEASDNFQGNLTIQWTPPWNLEFLNKRNTLYNIWVKIGSDDNFLAYETDLTRIILSGVEIKTVPSVWIRCIYEAKEGPISSEVKCKHRTVN